MSKPKMICGDCKKKLFPDIGHLMLRNHEGYLVGYQCWDCRDKQTKRENLARIRRNRKADSKF